jgi:hypothetical protein
VALIVNPYFVSKKDKNWDFNKCLNLISDLEVKDIFYDGDLSHDSLEVVKNNNLVIKYFKYEEVYKLTDDISIYLNQLGEVLSSCRTHNIACIIIPMIKYSDLIKDLDVVCEALNEIYQICHKHKVEVVISPDYNYDLNVYQVLIKKVKNIQILFSLEQIYRHNLSIITNYRLLKNNIKIIEVSDIDASLKASLLGYGVLEVVEMFKKFNRDKFEGDILYTCNMYSTVAQLETQNKFKLFFQRKKKVMASSIKEKLDVEKGENLDFPKLFANQINVLKIMVKNI